MTPFDANGSTGSPFMYDAALKVLRTLRLHDFEALLAGGCVRDIMLRKRPSDYDVVTNAPPDEVKKLFERTVPVGEKYGVVKVLMAGQQFEVATFRVEGGYADGRRPSEVRFAGAREDAIRRDFTINGMFYDPIEGVTVDYVGGTDDLDAKMIRAIGDPEIRFSEDYLRMLRAVRFATTLGFRIESHTMKAIKANAHRISAISAERIRAELEKILTHKNRRKGLELLDDTGLLKEILPEVTAGKGVKQGKKLHPEGDVWQHTLLSVAGIAEEASFEFVMAVLLHDIGKPPTASPGSERPFLDHERVGEEMAVSIAGRLRLSKKETAIMGFLVRNHLVFKDVQNMKKSTLKRLVGHQYFAELAELHRIDAMASNKDFANYDFAMEAKESISREVARPAPLLSGDDLGRLGVSPGPEMGRILKVLYNAQLEEEINTFDEAVAMAKDLIDRGR